MPRDEDTLQREELDLHKRIIRENEYLGRFSPYTDNIEYHKRRVSELTGKPYRDMSEEKKGLAKPKSYSKGGIVRKTGMAKVHKGEKVLTKKQVTSKGKK